MKLYENQTFVWWVNYFLVLVSPIISKNFSIFYFSLKKLSNLKFPSSFSYFGHMIEIDQSMQRIIKKLGT